MQSKTHCFLFLPRNVCPIGAAEASPAFQLPAGEELSSRRRRRRARRTSLRLCHFNVNGTKRSQRISKDLYTCLYTWESASILLMLSRSTGQMHLEHLILPIGGAS